VIYHMSDLLVLPISPLCDRSRRWL